MSKTLAGLTVQKVDFSLGSWILMGAVMDTRSGLSKVGPGCPHLSSRYCIKHDGHDSSTKTGTHPTIGIHSKLSRLLQQ